MSNATSNRNRWIPATPKAPLRKFIDVFQRADVWLRIGLCLAITTILYVVMIGWNPPFQYRLREAPQRNLHAHTEFEYDDYRATEEARNRVRRNFLCLYEHDTQQLEEVRSALTNDLFKIAQSEFEDVDAKEVWAKFFAADDDNADQPSPENFAEFKESISKDGQLERLQDAIAKSFIEINSNGLIDVLTHEIGQGNFEEIEVFPKGNVANSKRVNISDVRIAEIIGDLKTRMSNEIQKEDVIENPELVAKRVFDWLKPRLPITLTWDEARSKSGAEAAASAVERIQKIVAPGDALESERRDLDTRVITAGVPLNDEDISLLRAEHNALVNAETIGTKVVRSIFFYGLYAAMFLLVTQYLYLRDPELLNDLKQFSILLGLILVTLTVAWLVALNEEWRSEIVPITIFTMTIAIAYHIELALLLGALVSFAFSVSHGFGLAEFVVLTAASSSSALMCQRIRSRTKLVNVGLTVAVIVLPTAIGVSYMLGQPLEWALFTNALWYAGGAGIAGLVMTALLPFLERWFDIQTDISLLELSDANHPLLKELVQRAPGTYNHSINVASMSEAAAEAIGANGLLCRVAAYFHDVGKLRKPEYFIENQSGGINKHDDLVPTMSTLVIIAHVKDGSDIAKKHRLPGRIIDLIEQHHGTTLVEYFYRRAEKQLEESGDAEATVDEADYRYPGPKPQTPEAAVMMLADAVESASRALREPAPARIEGLVQDIANKKFDDGQFDECEITIEQLNTIEESLIKSLNAMYHARVKYPEQQTA
ncbi:MAG: HDIG domain-containing metalloprotein [Planctomycetota bacterium]